MDQERWMTPPEVWEPLHAEFGFDLDAFADEQTKRLPHYLSPTANALSPQEWPGERIWMNPPYGRKLDPSVRRGFQEARKSKLVVALIPMRVRGPWWHEAVLGQAFEVRCVRKRIAFLRPDGTRGRFVGSQDSCIVIWDGYVGPYRHTRIVGWEQAA